MACLRREPPFCVEIVGNNKLLFFFSVVGQSLKAVKLSSQQIPTFLLFRGRRGVAQHCWIRLHRLMGC